MDFLVASRHESFKFCAKDIWLLLPWRPLSNTKFSRKRGHLTLFTGWKQYDQMDRKLFNIRPFTSRNIFTTAYKICQTLPKIFPYIKNSLKQLPKTLKILPKWRNLAKSGHTGCERSCLQIFYRHLVICNSQSLQDEPSSLERFEFTLTALQTVHGEAEAWVGQNEWEWNGFWHFNSSRNLQCKTLCKILVRRVTTKLTPKF